MSTIQSKNDDLLLNASGTGAVLRLQINGTDIFIIDSSGNMSGTSFANKNGDPTLVFSVANATLASHAINKGQFDQEKQAMALLIDGKLSPSDIVDNLISTSNILPLSANQGRVLNETLAQKVNITDVIDTLSSVATTKPLSARQGKLLNDAISALNNGTNIVSATFANNTLTFLNQDGSSESVVIPDQVVLLVDGLTSTDTTKALTANQGRILNDKINNISSSSISDIDYAILGTDVTVEAGGTSFQALPTANTWGSSFYGTRGLYGNLELTFEFYRPDQLEVNSYIMCGLSTNPSADSNYTTIDYAFYKTAQDNNSSFSIYEDGSGIVIPTTLPTIGRSMSIKRQGNLITYSVDGKRVREKMQSNIEVVKQLFIDSSTYVNGGVKRITFGSITTLARNRMFKHTYTTPRSISNSNAVVVTTTPTYTINADKDVTIDVKMPLRNDKKSWGGFYVQMNLQINGTWYNMGNCGYDGGVMADSARMIATWTSHSTYELISQLTLPTDKSYTLKVELTGRTYTGTVLVNSSHDMNRTSNGLGNRGNLNGLSVQNFTTVYIEEKDRKWE